GFIGSAPPLSHRQRCSVVRGTPLPVRLRRGDSAQSAARRLTELESELRPRRAANTLPFCMAYQGMPFAFIFAARDDRVVPIKQRRRSSGTSSLGLRAGLGRE